MTHFQGVEGSSILLSRSKAARSRVQTKLSLRLAFASPAPKIQIHKNLSAARQKAGKISVGFIKSSANFWF